MKISQIDVRNFKSFDDVSINFNDFNIIIGSNAAGKSNLVDIVKFVRDIEKWGLDSAISLQGGVDYLLNLKIAKKEPLYIRLVFDIDPNTNGRRVDLKAFPGQSIGLSTTQIEFEIEIKFHLRGDKYTLTKNRAKFQYNLERISTVDNVASFESFSTFKVEMSSDGRAKVLKFKTEAQDGIDIDLEEIIPVNFITRNVEKKILIGQPFLGLFYTNGADLLSGVSVFDFTPKDIKCSSPIVGKLSLDENAKNLPVVLKKVLKDKSRRKKLVNLVSDLLPFVEDLKVTETADRSLLLEVKEIFTNKAFLPSTFLSDGTAHATALITALYFDPNSNVKVFEEPERNMHPELICKLVEHMKSYSHKKQVIVTTHNTELLRTAEPEDVLFISRKDCGSSKIERLSERSDVKTFLENEIGINELYANNLLVGF
ncbi:AAA family ATPase [Vibrio campbellii]|uniref:AAA family ATPase n=1 Tax=Vibrio campbellii TaxID=680 RepID=UPI00210EE20B|nr:AAA family ATPase [Vibrio campbellii]UTZ20918.1 AAA family ATPase [Vibrio campbellii]